MEEQLGSGSLYEPEPSYRDEESIRPILTYVLIGLNVLLFLPQLLGINVGGNEFTVLLCVAGDSFSRPWELVTAMFGHWSIDHLLMNMISLYWLGSLIEVNQGRLRFTFIYFASGIAGNVACVIFAPNVLSAGASGAIFGLLGAAALLLYMLRSIPEIRSMLRGMLTMIGINVINSFLPGISMEAHFGGLAAGVAVQAVILAIDWFRMRGQLEG